MGEVLADVPESEPVEPDGIETVRIDLKSGEPSSGPGTRLEIFMEDNLPAGMADAGAAGGDASSSAVSVGERRRDSRERAEEVEQLF